MEIKENIPSVRFGECFYLDIYINANMQNIHLHKYFDIWHSVLKNKIIWTLQMLDWTKHSITNLFSECWT
jgi:hypothetical protein